MKINVLTVFPEMFSGIKDFSIVKKAIEKKQLLINVVNFRTFSDMTNNGVDDTPYGGGAGMVIKYLPIRDALKTVSGFKVILTPRGKKLTQEKLLNLSKLDELTLIAPHYEGYDERINTLIDEELSVGDFVLSGGEVPALLLIDGIARLLEGVINNESLKEESFNNGLLEYDQYTKPQTIDNLSVPEVLISGNHEKIRKFRLYSSIKNTYKRRPDLLEKRALSKEEQEILQKIKEE